MNKNILMLCYYYPPLTDVGGKRSIAFSKYLKKNGWNPYIISIKNPDKGYCSIGNDKPPQGINIEYSYSIINLSKLIVRLNALLTRAFRLININIKRNYFYLIFCIPDLFWGWVPLTAIKGVRLIKRYNIDIIYVSCSPWSSAFTCIIIKIITGKPLILDYRDPYALETAFLRFNVPMFREKLDRNIQKYFLKHTDIFIVNNDEIRRIYFKEYPQAKEKIFAIHNGFESEFMIQKKAEKYPKFTIVYTGDFYFYALESKIFFEGIALLKQKGKINKDTFHFLFYGDGKDEIKRIAIDYGIEDVVMASSRIPYNAVLDVISNHI